MGIVVSHDRTLLDALTTRTARLDARGLTLSAGSYSAALREWQAERAATQSAGQALQREGKRLSQRADQQRRRAAAAERQRNAGRRMKDRHDHDATCILKSNQAEQAGRRRSLLEIGRAQKLCLQGPNGSGKSGSDPEAILASSAGPPAKRARSRSRSACVQAPPR